MLLQALAGARPDAWPGAPFSPWTSPCMASSWAILSTAEICAEILAGPAFLVLSGPLLLQHVEFRLLRAQVKQLIIGRHSPLLVGGLLVVLAFGR